MLNILKYIDLLSNKLRNWGLSALSVSKIKKKMSEKKCDFMEYEIALAHNQICEFKKQECPQKCGELLFNSEITKHKLFCKNFKTICYTCTISYYPNL